MKSEALWHRIFANFTIRGRFFKKMQNISQNFQVLLRQADITIQWLYIAGTTELTFYTGCLVSIFTVRLNSESFFWAVPSAHERYLHKFSATSDIGCCVLKPIVRRSAGAAWRVTIDILQKNKLNWKLKISHVADNADITQSQARDTWHRRMQELNSLCTDSLRDEYCIVFIPHNTAI